MVVIFHTANLSQPSRYPRSSSCKSAPLQVCQTRDHSPAPCIPCIENVKLTDPIVRASKAPGRRKVRLTLYVLPHSGPSGLDPKDHQSAHLIDHKSQSQLRNPASMYSTLLTTVTSSPRRTWASLPVLSFPAAAAARITANRIAGSGMLQVAGHADIALQATTPPFSTK